MIDAPIQLLCSPGLRLRKRCCRFCLSAVGNPDHDRVLLGLIAAVVHRVSPVRSVHIVI